MIIANGTIEAKIKTGGGIDPKTDYPIAPSVSWGNPIPCQYRANKYSNKGRANGEAFTIASYEILIDEQPYDATVAGCRRKNARRIFRHRNRAVTGGLSITDFGLIWEQSR